MEIRFHKHFEKRYKKLPLELQEKVQQRMTRFMRDPHDPILRNHALSGHLVGRRVFSVTSNVRVMFEEYENYTFVLMLDVGTHPHVYGD